jgi:hypothetical protein
MPLPDSELTPCGTRAAYRRHLRRGLRGLEIDEACRQAEVRAWEDRVAAGQVARSRLARVHLDGPGRCYREDVITTADPAKVTCLHCLDGYRRLPWVRAAAQAGGLSRAA